MTTSRSARSRRVFLIAVGVCCLATLIFVVIRWAIIAADRQQTAEERAKEEQALPTDPEARGTAGAAEAQRRRKVLTGRQTPVVFDETSLVDFLRKERTKHGLAALLCGVWHDEDELLTVALGNSMTDEPATREMHLRVGGVTLTCVCTMLLRLVDERRVSLDDRLSRWYPKLPQADAVTLRMLANCTSGYPDYVASQTFIDQFYKDPFRQWRAQELIDFGLATPLLYKPGTGWNYSHTNFVILGEVLQKVGGMPMAALLTRHICQPLGLKETEYPATATMRFPVLHAFSSERGIYEDSTYWSPSWTSYSGQMTSTLGDLGVLARTIGSGSLLSEKSRTEQIAPTTVGLGRNRADHYYGMGIILLNGWMVQNPRFGGFNLIFAHLPARQLSIVIATTLGPKTAPDPAYSTLIFREIVNRLVPDTPIPEEGK
jgi:D-alanyl-D-alanine carboxypeptidase